MLEYVVFKRHRNFCWQVRDQNGKMVASGREKTRPAARYHAYRALFLVLSTGIRPDGCGIHRIASRQRAVNSPDRSR